MTAGLRIGEAELKTLLVTQLEVMDEAEFEKVRTVASRFKIPFEQAVVERGGIPMRFLLEQLGKLWGVEFTPNCAPRTSIPRRSGRCPKSTRGPIS